MSSDTQRELNDLAAVNTFYVSLLKEKLGHAIPVPAWAGANAAQASDSAQTIALLHSWLDLLNLAVNASLVRGAAWDQQPPATAESLLRYLVRKRSPAESERDKTDFISTMLYRNRTPSGGTADPKYPIKFAGADAPDFEAQLTRSLEGAALPELSVEHGRTLAEFQFFYEEFEELKDFNSLMDSGMVVRVRDLKSSLGEGFYHPRALAVMAAWNARFRARFDELFNEATEEIKAFAASVQQEGASLLSRVDGDVTVKQLTEAGAVASGALQQEYGKAHEKMRAISKLKKAVDSRQGGKKPGRTMAAAAGAGPSGGARMSFQQMGFSATDETSQLRSLMNHIAGHVREVEATKPCIVPLPNGNLTLLPAEIEAYKADYVNEKSFRADFANSIRRAVAINSRMMTELNEVQAKRSKSSYLWKPHADNLATLLMVAQQEIEYCQKILETAKQRGLADNVKAISAAIQKLQNQRQHVALMLKGC